MKRDYIGILVLVIAVAGCSIGDMLSGGAGGGSSPTSKAGSDPKAEVIAASKKFIDLPAFSAKMEGVGQFEIKQQVDFAAPDRFHIIYLAGAAPGMEIITIGNESYMKTGGKWSKMPGGPNTSTPNLRDSYTEEGLKTLTDVKYEGEESVDGKSARVYTYKNVTPKGDFPFGAKLYVNSATGVPMKVVVDYTNGTLKQMTVNYDTETPVKIEPPI